MIKDNLIFTISGIRGVVGKDFTKEVAKNLALAFSTWYTYPDKKVIIGRDTRPSGKYIKEEITQVLKSKGFEIIDVGVCPTPIIIHAKQHREIPAGIIVTGSHNSQEWNGIKILYLKSYLSREDLNQIYDLYSNVNTNFLNDTETSPKKDISHFNPISYYIETLYHNIDVEAVRANNTLRVVVDTGAGAAKLATPQILESLGCKIKSINNDLLVNKMFPRGIEPVKKNLHDLIMEVWQGNYDIGFAHDSDADRLAIIGEDGTCYPEDVGLALIADYYLKNNLEEGNNRVFVTNLASSLMFDALAEKYKATMIRTPVGEKYLVEKMNELILDCNENDRDCLVFGGEGSCGGVMLPRFNNTRDGIFAAAKLVEIMVKSGEKISSLVKKLPKYYSHRELISISNEDVELIINKVKEELINEGEEVLHVHNDLRFGDGKDWFVLIHPSNTEPILRVISEAKQSSFARIYCETAAELIRMVIKRHR